MRNLSKVPLTVNYIIRPSLLTKVNQVKLCHLLATILFSMERKNRLQTVSLAVQMFQILLPPTQMVTFNQT